MSLSPMHSSRTEEAAPQKLSDDIRILKNKCVLGGEAQNRQIWAQNNGKSKYCHWCKLEAHICLFWVEVV